MPRQLDIFEAERRRAMLRDYQGHALELLIRKPGLCVMATGTGKTEVFCALAYHLPGPGLVLAHTQELVSQAAKRLAERTGLPVGVEQADRTSNGEPLIVASMATACKPKRLAALVAKGIRWICIDEAHHALCASYMRIVEEFPFLPVYGFTATPFRGDGRALGKVFPEARFTYGIREAIEDGWLVPLVGEQIEIQELDLTEVPTSMGDLQPKALDNAMLRAVEGICQELVSRYPSSKGPLFWPGKFSARLAHARLNQLMPGSSVLLTEDMPPWERAALKTTLAAGKARWLCNVNIATEGFDWPEATIIGMCRPTKSLGLYTQMVGRVTRPLAGVVDGFPKDERHERIATSGKPQGLVLDFVGNCGRHKLVSMVDLMAGSFSPAEVKKAKELERFQKGTPLELLESARRELTRLTQAMRSNRLTTTRRFDFFAATGVRPVGFHKTFGDRPATPGQIDYLQLHGVPVPTDLTFASATRAIVKVKERESKSLATPRQLAVLSEAGWKGRNIGKGGASKVIAEFQRTKKARDNKGWMEFLSGDRRP